VDTFTSTLVGWDAVCDANKGAIADGWDIAAHALQLQADALDAIAASDFDTVDRRNAVITCGAHYFRTSSAHLGLVARGAFDTAPYLTRALYDTQSLILGSIVLDSTFIAALLDGRVRDLPSDARRGLESAFRESGDSELAQLIRQRFKTHVNAGHEFAHVNAFHLRRVLAPLEDASWGVSLKGFHHPIEARAHWATNLEITSWALTWYSLGIPSHLSAEWMDNYETFRTNESAYRASSRVLLKEEYRP